MSLRESLERWGLRPAPAGHHHSRRGWVNLDCPWCHTLGKFHLGINERSYACSCWRCGKRSTYAAIMLLNSRAPAKEVLQMLGEPVKGKLASTKTPVAGKYEAPPAEPLGKHHKAYLRSRGYDPEEIAALWGVQGIGFMPEWRKLKLSWRLLIPVEFDGELVSWTTRSIKPEVEARYLSAPPDCERVSIKDVVYGLQYVTHTAIIMEGSTDVWRVGPGGVCTMGTSVSDSQILTLGRVPRRVIAFDNSRAAQRRAAALATELSTYPGVTQIVELEGDDPATAPEEEIRDLRAAFL